MSDYEYAIGTTAENLQNLEDDLGIPPPHPAPFREWAVDYEAGDGQVYGDGPASAEWHWDYLGASHIAALRVYCTGKSSAVYIKTLKADLTTYGIYYVVMIWPSLPDDATYQMGRVSTNFVIRFTHLQEV